MFRCVTQLKGIIVDVDSFPDIVVSRWSNLSLMFKCVFITSDEQTQRLLSEIYKEDSVLFIPDFFRFFVPNSKLHTKVLDRLNLKTMEVAYVSSDKRFIDNALGFFSGTIWVTESVSYREASSAPDLVCKNVDILEQLLQKNVGGYLGEVYIDPLTNSSGIIMPVKFEVDDNSYLLFMLGRYFGNSHYMNQLHPYSSAVYLNKKEGKAFGIFDREFYSLYKSVIESVKKRHRVDCICAVPARPGKQNRFESIVEDLSSFFDIENLTSSFVCTQDYPIQKSLSSMEREENVKDVFDINEDLQGKNIVIIDDIITTGATIKECVRTLINKGAEDVFIIVLGINQIGNYWSSNEVKVKCPKCGEKMYVLVNSNNKSFFYSCGNCRSSLNYDVGIRSIQDIVDKDVTRDDDEDSLL